MIARRALWLLAGAAVVGVMASARQDLTRYLKIKQMSHGNGHPENPQDPIDEGSPDLQVS